MLPLNNSNSRKLLALDDRSIAGRTRNIRARVYAAAAALLFRSPAAFSLCPSPPSPLSFCARARNRNPQLYEKSFSCFVDGHPSHVAACETSVDKPTRGNLARVRYDRVASLRNRCIRERTIKGDRAAAAQSRTLSVANCVPLAVTIARVALLSTEL